MSDASFWYIGINGQQQGPLGTQQIIDLIRAGHVNQTAYVYGQLQPQWTPIAQVAAFAPMFSAAAAPPPPPPAGPAPTVADVIDFEILGGEMQFVEIVLDPGEAAIADAGALFYMDPGIKLDSTTGLTLFGNGAQARQKVSFAASSPGKILPIDLRQHGGTLLCQKDAFLCAAKGISTAVTPNNLQKLEGQGLAFLHAGGTLVARDLKPGETLRIDLGCLLAFEPTVGCDLQPVAALTGPGKVWLQSLPSSRLAARVLAVRTP